MRFTSTCAAMIVACVAVVSPARADEFVADVSPARASGFDTTGAPAELPYKKGEKAPVGYHLEGTPRSGEIASGIALFALSYGAVVAIGAADKFENKKGYVLAPLVGPALWVFSRSSEHDGEAAPGFILFGGVVDALFQVGAAVIVLRECVNPPKRYVRDASRRFFVRPALASSFIGASIAGAF